MANAASQFYYWYRRYKVRAADMTGLQTGLVEGFRGLAEGAFGASVLKGLAVSPQSGLTVQVATGIAVAASGYLEVLNVATNISTAGVSGVLPVNALIVLRPNPVDNTTITSPTDPFSTVPLNQSQGCQVVVIGGTPNASPVYPSKGTNDVILAGIKLGGSPTTITQSMIDLSVRESLMVNSQIGKIGQIDAYVGYNHPLAKYGSLAAALADTGLAPGTVLLVTQNETVDATMNVTVPNIEIRLKPGITMTKGTATTGMNVSASGIVISGGRMAGAFNSAIAFSSGGDYGLVEKMRFASTVITPIDDSLCAHNASVIGTISEV